MQRAVSAGKTCRSNAASNSLPDIEVVSSNTRKQITEGKLVNLAVLLMPKAESSDYRQTEFNGQSFQLREDPRINRTLTLVEFITAFGVYKNVLCEPQTLRRAEMDKY